MKPSLRKIRRQRKYLRVIKLRERIFDYLFDAMFDKAWEMNQEERKRNEGSIY